MSPFAIAAPFYAKRGLYVFPLGRRSKEPTTAHGFHDSTIDAARIAQMATRYPRANIGIACAASGVVVIDPDRRNGGEEAMDALVEQLGPLPTTWTVLTADGAHFYFRAPASVRFVGSLAEGVDVKHDGYVVAPPSIHPSGRRYEWEASSRFDEVALAELPPAWLRAMTERSRGKVLPSSGVDAKDSHLGACFDAMGWLGDALPDGRRMVRCPWVEAHSDERGSGEDSSAVLFPRAVGATLGGFRCSHAHCAARTWRNVLDVIPLDVRAAATKAIAPTRRSKAYAVAALARAAANVERGDVATLTSELASLARFVRSGALETALLRRVLLDAAAVRGLPDAERLVDMAFPETTRRAS